MQMRLKKITKMSFNSHKHWQTIEKLQLTPTNECWNAHFIPPLSTQRWKHECENHDRSTRPNHGGVKYTAAQEREEWKLLHAWLFSNYYSSMLHVCHVMWNQDRKPIRKGQRSMRMLPSDSLEQWIKFPIWSWKGEKCKSERVQCNLRLTNNFTDSDTYVMHVQHVKTQGGEKQRAESCRKCSHPWAIEK